MDYLKPFTFFVGAAGGRVNLLWCAVCNLIPVAGQVALLGYRAEVADDLVRGGHHPAFRFDRFGFYLRRGLAPFAYQAAAGLTVGVVLVGGGLMARRAVDAMPTGADPHLFLAAVALGWLGVVLAAYLVAAFALWPMELHAQLSRRFAPAAAVGFARRFQRRVWGQMLIALVVFLAAAGVLLLAGLLCVYVGVYPAAVVVFMAQQHLVAQLYRLYLDDGGEPVVGPDDGDV